MTILSRATLKLSFENGDVPQGSDYGNMIDSALNLADTSLQTMQGPLSVPSLVATTLSTTGLTLSTLSVTSSTALTGTTTVDNATITAGNVVTLTAPTANITNANISGNLTYGVTGFPVLTVGNFTGVGTIQGTATLVTSPLCILNSSASNDAYILSNSLATGSIQRFYAGGGSTFSIFPPSGGTIDGGSTNTAISLSSGDTTTIVKFADLSFVQFV